MKRLLEFFRAMRASGFRYRQLKPGLGYFVKFCDVGGRRAYASVAVSAQQILDTRVAIAAMVKNLTIAADHRLDRLAAA
ncbi:hypothetical protein M9978_02375 [Sphingomonas sp. MG17]|uniref:Uncharacterized protein n=1 Tax=Sphingomonas tagetis TaxID=2949092 RepID=A0A9X2HGS1_9SPHN|nr:hypothetical protein [Sphingomonas tagetis]MCP3729262.1 hypothetical protein [Sphingomonas tagetis]